MTVMGLRDQLARDEAVIAEENEHIAQQEQAIKELKARGHSIDQAERSLEMMRRARAGFVHHRKILLERLGLYRP
jgi:hypothetical protein